MDIKRNFTRINLRLKSLDSISLNLYNIFINKILNQNWIKNYICTTTKKIKRITLLKSPHVNKKAQEHFMLKSYQTFISFSISKSIMEKVIILLLNNKSKHIDVFIKIK